MIALLQLLDPRDPSCQAIILVHNKDLCHAIRDLITVVSKYMQISWSVCVGGYPVRQDVEKLRNVGHQIILGTPGKYLKLLESNFFLNVLSIFLVILFYLFYFDTILCFNY